MAKVCQVTGKRPVAGNNVSHAKNRTRRRFLPNLHTHRFWVESEKRFVKLRLSAKGMRIVDKVGIDDVLKQIRADGGKVVWEQQVNRSQSTQQRNARKKSAGRISFHSSGSYRKHFIIDLHHTGHTHDLYLIAVTEPVGYCRYHRGFSFGYTRNRS